MCCGDGTANVRPDQIHRPLLEVFAKHALNCYDEPERILDTVLIVMLQGNGDSFDAFDALPPERAFSLVDARAMPAASYTDMCGPQTASMVEACRNRSIETRKAGRSPGFVFCHVTVIDSRIANVLHIGIPSFQPPAGWVRDPEWEESMRDMIAAGVKM